MMNNNSVTTISILLCLCLLLIASNNNRNNEYSFTVAKRIGNGEQRNEIDNNDEYHSSRKLQGFDFAFDIPNIFSTTFKIYVCFSSENLVTVLDTDDDNEATTSTTITMKKMKDIRIGDRVLTSTGTYEPIYSLDHRHPTKLTSFLQIHYAYEGNSEGYDNKTDSPHPPIEVTERHMIFLQNKANPVPASAIKVGDQLRTMNMDYNNKNQKEEKMMPLIVTKITNIQREGLFNPLTPDGTIVINNDIVASTYSAFFYDMKEDNNKSSSNTEYVLGDNDNDNVMNIKMLSHQELMHHVLTPYRFICTAISMELCKTTNEFTMYDYLGMMLFHYGYEKLETQPTIQRMVLVSFVFTIQVLAIVLHWFGITIIVALLVSYYYIMKKSTPFKRNNIKEKLL